MNARVDAVIIYLFIICKKLFISCYGTTELNVEYNHKVKVSWRLPFETILRWSLLNLYH